MMLERKVMFMIFTLQEQINALGIQIFKKKLFLYAMVLISKWLKLFVQLVLLLYQVLMLDFTAEVQFSVSDPQPRVKV